MRQMKDSGVKWIGEVPEGWVSAKSKYFITSNDSGVWGEEPKGDSLDKIVIRSTEQTIDGKWDIIDPAIRNIGSLNAISSIKSGDLLITKSSGSQLHIGKTTIADDWFNNKEVYFSNFIQRIRVHDCLPIFIWYLMNSILVREQFVYRQNATSGLGNINACDINNIFFPIPPLPEQQAIASYLDKKCGEIDRLVGLQEEMIAELKAYKQSIITEAVTKGLDPDAKMKDSGVEWIGEIPEEWRVERFKKLFFLRKGLSITKADLTPTGIAVLSYGQIHSKNNSGVAINDELLRKVPESFEDTDPSAIVSKGDFIFADTSEDIAGCGNCAYVDINIKLFAGYHTIIASPIDSLEYKYLAYLFQTFMWRSQIGSRVSGIKVFSISQRILAMTTIILPPLPEQHRISTYLDTKTSEIDQLIAIKQQKIIELKEYKKSLIYECVTGKKEILQTTN